MWTFPIRLRSLLKSCVLVAVLFAASAPAPHAARSVATLPQPYLATIGRPSTLPSLAPVKVAIVDTGVDGEHPDLAGRIVGARSFGSGKPLYPESPHGTAVAGLIGAIDGNGQGIDGIAPNARLLVASVGGGDSPSSFDADSIVRAIRWAADRHARVINLSLAGLGPVPGYEQAVDYATARGALVIAAAGNCFDRHFARCTPAGFTEAPAWLPHVLTVGATTAEGIAAEFSIPSKKWVDLAAPGELVTTLWPTRNNPYFATPDCGFAGTTGCYSTGGADSAPWGPSGTSFATAMVSAAAAILFGADPALRPEQVVALLEQTARPVADPLHQTGAGLLDIGAALGRVEKSSIPSADYGEPNDRRLGARAVPRARVIRATLDWRDDPVDVYRLKLRRGERLTAYSRGTVRGTVCLAAATQRPLLASAPIGRKLRYLARRSGTYLLRVTSKAATRGSYRLAISRR
jgi:subtilisin family serine protease